MSNIIPIGGDCSVALLLKTLELRKASYPFDWITCSFNSAISLIDNNFLDFIDSRYLERDVRKTHLHVFHSTIYNVGFFHDFNQMDDLTEQCESVKEKYDRRINRFYESLQEEAILIRLMTNECDIYFYKENKSKIEELIKSYNVNNKLLVFETIDDIKKYLKE